MIHFVLREWAALRTWLTTAARLTPTTWSVAVISRQGKVRLTKWYSPYSSKEKARTVREVSSIVLARQPKQCNFIEYKGRKIIYKRCCAPPSPAAPPLSVQPPALVACTDAAAIRERERGRGGRRRSVHDARYGAEAAALSLTPTLTLTLL